MNLKGISFVNLYMICTTCNIDKDKILFLKNKQTCKQCKSIYNKTYYSNNRQKCLDKAKRNNKIYFERNRKLVYEYLLEHPCVDCGEANPVKLDFDHTRDKLEIISKLVRNGIKLEKLKQEIAKCQVRCANCHRLKTAKENNWWIHQKYSAR